MRIFVWHILRRRALSWNGPTCTRPRVRMPKLTGSPSNVLQRSRRPKIRLAQTLDRGEVWRVEALARHTSQVGKEHQCTLIFLRAELFTF